MSGGGGGRWAETLWRAEAKGAGGVTGADQSEILLNAVVSPPSNVVDRGQRRCGRRRKKQKLCGFNSVDVVFPVTLIIRLCGFGSSK